MISRTYVAATIEALRDEIEYGLTDPCCSDAADWNLVARRLSDVLSGIELDSVALTDSVVVPIPAGAFTTITTTTWSGVSRVLITWRRN